MSVAEFILIALVFGGIYGSCTFVLGYMHATGKGLIVSLVELFSERREGGEA